MSCGLISKAYPISELSLEHINLNARVTNFMYNLTTEMRYMNKSSKIIDAKFIFPVNNVAIYFFRAVIQDREIISECRPRAEAHETFDEAVKSGHAAFLSEQDEQCEDLFQMSIGNVPGKTPVIITLKYVGHLEAENVKQSDVVSGSVMMTLPQVLNPRYDPASRKAQDSWPFPFDKAITNCKYTINFEAVLSMPYPILNVSSLKDIFKVDFTSEDHRSATVTLANDFTADHDFQMSVNMKDVLESSSVVEQGDSSSTGLTSMHCLMMQFMPDLDIGEEKPELRTELVFVIDRSGSMQGQRIVYAKDALLLFLKSIPKGCRFQLIGFGSYHEALFTEPVDYTEDSFKKAMEYQKSLEADMGGTEVYEALKSAFDYPLIGSGWYRDIIFLTDGEVMNVNDVIGLVGSNTHKARLCAIGIGEGVSTHLVSGIARAGRGRADYLRDGSQLQSTVAKILNAALKPRANDLKIDVKLEEKSADGSTNPLDVLLLPKRIPPILTGLYNTVYALFKADDLSNVCGYATLTFELNGQQKSIPMDLSSCMLDGRVLKSSDLELHRLAGKCQLSDLTDEYKAIECHEDADNKENGTKKKQLREQIEKLSCLLNILSIFTTFIGVDPKKQDITANKKVRQERDVGYAGGRTHMFRKSCGSPASGSARRALPAIAAPAMLCSEPITMCSEPITTGHFKMCSEPITTLEPEDCLSAEGKPDSFTALVSLQNFAGDWELASRLADEIGTTLDKLKASVPISWGTNKTTPMTPEIWATALAIALFELVFPERKVDWSLIVKKATNWLTEQAQKYSPDTQMAEEGCRALLLEAKVFLESTGVKKN